MKVPATVLPMLLVLGACSSGQEQSGQQANQQAAAPARPPVVVVQTNLGTITMEVYPDKAPETVSNFLAHVRAGFYDGLTFHRIMPGFVIQTGEVMPDFTKHTSQATAVPNENPNGLSNTRGTVAMARALDPNSAISEWYINLANNSDKLDFRDSTLQGFGYVVFGRVTSGMSVVDSIANIPTRAYRNYPSFPTDPPVIERMFVRER